MIIFSSDYHKKFFLNLILFLKKFSTSKFIKKYEIPYFIKNLINNTLKIITIIILYTFLFNNNKIQYLKY